MEATFFELRGADGASSEGEAPRRAPDATSATGAGRFLVCARCGCRVTRRSAEIAVRDAHVHDCVNPHGYLYRIGCFDAAPGCAPAGPQSSQWTWFPGYVWRVAGCRGCGGHLGWAFRSGDHAFFGLILDRLVEDEEDPVA